MQTKKKLLGVSLLNWLIASLLLAGLLAWLAQQMGWLQPTPAQTVTVAFDENCDLRGGPCRTRLENGAVVSLEIQPRNIPVAKTLDVEVTVSGMRADGVALDLNGVNMKMPPNRVVLQQVEPGHFNGQAGLMLCSRSAMEWEARVELATAQEKIIVPFRFITVSDPNFKL